MVTFTDAEKSVLDTCLRILEKEKSSFATIVGDRIKDIEQIATIVDRAPSPNTDLLQSRNARTSDSLADKLIKHGLNHVVNLPAKAVLGHGLTVSKLHLFGLLMKLVDTVDYLDICKARIERQYNDLLFTLMAEDLYTALISDADLDTPWLKEAVHELITMWDRRTSGYLETFALAIRDLWAARHTIVPVLGTLLGTVEIMRISAMLPDLWSDFLAQVSQYEEFVYSLEAFLFDLTYEELVDLRTQMSEEGIRAIDRNTSLLMLGKKESSEVEASAALALYRSYMSRQALAKKHGIKNYIGLANQNSALLRKMRGY